MTAADPRARTEAPRRVERAWVEVGPLRRATAYPGIGDAILDLL